MLQTDKGVLKKNKLWSFLSYYNFKIWRKCSDVDSYINFRPTFSELISKVHEPIKFTIKKIALYLLLCRHFLVSQRTSAQIATWPHCGFVVVSVHWLRIFKIAPLNYKHCHQFPVLHNHQFYAQHFCLYLTENMTRANFKKPKILNYLLEIYTCKNQEKYSTTWEISQATILQ